MLAGVSKAARCKLPCIHISAVRQSSLSHFSLCSFLPLLLCLAISFSVERKKNVWETLTLLEAWWVVINICDHYGHRGGAGETAHLSCHVCCLDDQLITILRFTVQIRHCCHDDP